MAMSRKDYVAFAQVIADRLDAVEGYTDRATVEYEINELAEDLMSVFKSDNHRFDVSRFREAAGLNKPGRNTESRKDRKVREMDARIKARALDDLHRRAY
jgi:hypothetical protein